MENATKQTKKNKENHHETGYSDLCSSCNECENDPFSLAVIECLENTIYSKGGCPGKQVIDIKMDCMVSITKDIEKENF